MSQGNGRGNNGTPPSHQSATPPSGQRRRSPSRGRSRVRRNGGEIVVQQVVRETGGGSGTNLSFPMLTRSNYTNWAMVMEVNLQAASLWEAIEDETVPRREDKQALAALLRSTPSEMHCMLVGKGSAKAAWEAIRLQYQGNDRVRDSRVRRLRTEFETVTFKANERIDEFTMHISNIASALRSLGDSVDEEKVVRKFLSVVPTRFVQIAFSIETLLSPATLTVEEVVGHLRAVEERLDDDQGGSSSGQLLLTEEQWEARKRQPRGGRTSGKGDGPGNGRLGNGRKGGQPQQQAAPTQCSGNNIGRNNCRYCGKKGHWAHECRKKQRDEAAAAAPSVAANLVQAEEDEGPGLMMACVEETFECPENNMTRTGGQVFLNEERAIITPAHGDDQGGEVWFLDTGATNHMTGSVDAFAELDRSVTGKVRFADSSVVDIHGRGTVVFAIDGGDHRAFTEVFFIPVLKSSVVSLGQLDESWYDIHIHRGILSVRDQRNRLLMKVQRSPNRLYKLRFTPIRPVCLAMGHVSDAWRWHARLGHLHFDGLQRMARGGLVRGLPHIEHADELCQACLAGKQRRLPFPQKAHYRAQKPLELVHGDLCGPITPLTPGGRRYILLLIDDRSRYIWVELLASKDEAARAILKFQAAAEVECGHKLRVLRTDRGGEFTSATFYEHCAESGVQRHLTAPYTRQQNGIVERRNQTVLGLARNMLKDKRVPNLFWGEAVLTAVFILNWCFTRSVNGMTPYEAWHGKKPDVRFLRVFGCVGHVKVARPHLQKLDDRSTPMVFIGYETGSKAYRMEAPASSSFTVEYPVYVTHAATSTATHSRDRTPASSRVTVTPSGTPSPARQKLLTTTPRRDAEIPPSGSTQVRFMTPPSVQLALFDAQDSATAPHQFRLVDDLLGAPAGTPQLAEQFFDDEVLHLVAGEEPTSFGHRAISLKWVFKVQKNEHGHIVKHKAWLVVKGYVQRHSVDFEEVFAPVARLESVRLILALAAHRGWEPPGFIADGHEHGVYKLHKALYGLRQAPRAWNAKLDASLASLGFTRSVTEHGVYARGTGNALLIVGVYVDDLVITGAEQREVHRFKEEMKRLFSMSDLGLLRYYLGLEVKQELGLTTITQAAYASKLLDKAGMAGCNAAHTPMEARCQLSKDSKETPVDATFYHSVIGSLRYLVHTRPDIAFAVGFLSRFMEAPAGDHLAAVKHLLRYIAGTLNHGCVYRRSDGDTLIGFSDSDHAGDVDSRKSTSGVLFFLGDSPVSWQSQKQKVVATSSCEAEYIAAATAACQGIWLARLFGELLNQEAAPVKLFIDNKSAISLCKNPVLHDRIKHIDLRYHFIRDCVENGSIVVEFIGTGEQKADILTKALGRIQFQSLRGKIDIIDVRSN
uniref:Uncharacterized protein n=1 Tax=Avena sativa TaxID=4498 RepID=A0ACD6AP94_AVESA